jgi:GAF domain-containing protein
MVEIPDKEYQQLQSRLKELEKAVAEQKRAEGRIKHLDSLLRATSRINQLIIKEKDRDLLFQRACEILREVKDCRFVWIGTIKESDYDVFPAAQAGFEEGYLKTIRVTWDDSPTGRGPTGMAIKTRQPSVMRDIANDPSFQPWREQALKRGYASSAAVPIIYNDRVYGAINKYSALADAFDEEEISILVELAGDIGFALHAIELETERKRLDAEAANKVKELEKLTKIMESREDRIIELKGEIKKLKGL